MFFSLLKCKSDRVNQKSHGTYSYDIGPKIRPLIGPETVSTLLFHLCCLSSYYYFFTKWPCRFFL